MVRTKTTPVHKPPIEKPAKKRRSKQNKSPPPIGSAATLRAKAFVNTETRPVPLLPTMSPHIVKADIAGTPVFYTLMPTPGAPMKINKLVGRKKNKPDPSSVLTDVDTNIEPEICTADASTQTDFDTPGRTTTPVPDLFVTVDGVTINMDELFRQHDST